MWFITSHQFPLPASSPILQASPIWSQHFPLSELDTTHAFCRALSTLATSPLARLPPCSSTRHPRMGQAAAAQSWLSTTSIELTFTWCLSLERGLSWDPHAFPGPTGSGRRPVTLRTADRRSCQHGLGSRIIKVTGAELGRPEPLYLERSLLCACPGAESQGPGPAPAAAPSGAWLLQSRTKAALPGAAAPRPGLPRTSQSSAPIGQRPRRGPPLHAIPSKPSPPDRRCSPAQTRPQQLLAGLAVT